MKKLPYLFVLSLSMIACTPLNHPVNSPDNTAPILVTEKSEKCVGDVKSEIGDNIDRIKDKGKAWIEEKQKEAEDILKEKEAQTKDWLKQKIDSL